MCLRKVLLIPLLILTACGTAQEQCIRKATGEIHRIDRLISESEKNLARGYSYESETITTHEWDMCVVPGGWGPDRRMHTYMCFRPETRTVQRAVPIDPAVETRKLENLRAKHKQLLLPANDAVKACKVTYPEV